MMDLSLLYPSLKRSRLNFVMPRVWPIKSSNQSIRESLDQMAQTSMFLDLCIALMSDPFWYMQYKSKGFKSLDSSIILGKQLLHSTYNFDGTMKSDLVFYLNYFTDETILQQGCERQMHDHKIEHFYGSRCNNEWSLNVWQCIQILIKRSIYQFDLECSQNFTKHDIESFHVIEKSETIQFIETNAFHFDALGICLRSAMCVTNLIQKLHLTFMPLKRPPLKFTGFKRCSEGLRFDKKITKNHKDQIWSNYLFDVAAMWMVARRFHESLLDSDSKDFIHACGKARLWSLTTGLAESSKNMLFLFENNEEMKKIYNCAVSLHFLYLRLWQHCLPAMRNHPSPLCLERCMARLSSQVFLKSDETIKIDHANCGTATLLDNSFQHTMLNPEILGLVYNGNQIFGLLPEDLNYSFYTGFISVAVTQSTQHLWVSVCHPESWIGQIDQGLSPIENYSKIEKWLQCSWCTYELLETEYKEFRKSHYKNHEKMQNEEIENILKLI